MRNGNEATVDIKDIKKGDAVSVFMTQVAAVSCAATQVPDTKLPSHNFLKVGLRNALQVEAGLVMAADSMSHGLNASRDYFHLGLLEEKTLDPIPVRK